MEMSYILIAALVAGFVIMLMLALGSQRKDHVDNVVAAMAHGASGMDIRIRDLEMSKSSNDRLLKPLLKRLHFIGRMLTPGQNVQQLQKDLIMAGLIEKFSVTDFMGLRVLVGAGLAVVGFAVVGAQQTTGSALLFGLIGFMIGLYFPNIWLKGRVTTRQTLLMRALPDALDMMSICVDAGLGFEAALQRVGTQWNNDLGTEFRLVIREMRVGLSRVDALHNLAERTGVADIASFVAVLIQADKLGIAIRDVLHTQAEQMRMLRRQRAEEAAAKAPLKMMFPMVFFIFPAMFAVILGPAIPRMMNMFK